MVLDFIGSNEYPVGTALSNQNWKMSEDKIRTGLVNLSSIAVGNVLVAPSVNQLYAEIGADFTTFYHRGITYPKIFNLITGLTLVEANYIATDKSTEIQPLGNFLDGSGKAHAGAPDFEFKSGNQLPLGLKGNRGKPRKLTEEGIRNGLVSLCKIAKDSSVAILPSGLKLHQACENSGFSTYLLHGMKIVDVLSMTTGLDVRSAKYVAVGRTAVIGPASDFLNQDGSLK